MRAKSGFVGSGVGPGPGFGVGVGLTGAGSVPQPDAIKSRDKRYLFMISSYIKNDL